MKGLQKSLVIGYVLAISGGIFWAVGGACGQYLVQHNEMTSKWLVPLRLTFAGLILLGCALLRRQNIWAVWHGRQQLTDLILFGLLGARCASTPTTRPFNIPMWPWPRCCPICRRQ